MWDSWVEAAKTSDPDAPQIRRYAEGAALKLIVSDLQFNRAQGQITRGEVVTSPLVVTLTPAGSPTEASILDCVSDADWLEYKRDGTLVDNGPAGSHRVTATVKRAGSEWKVTLLTPENAGTC